MDALKPKIDGWTIVVAGAWNRRIFTPAWITKTLTNSKEVGIELPVDNLLLPYRFTFDSLILVVTPVQLVISVERPLDSLLTLCRQTTINVLSKLPHTPVTAVGINYQFIADDPSPSLLSVFKLSDTDELSDSGIIVRSTAIHRKLAIDDQTVNLILNLTDDKKVHIQFNFHKDVSDAQQAIQYLNDAGMNLKEKALEILNAVYESNVETTALPA